MFKSMSKWALYGILVVVMLSLPVTVFALGGGDPEPGPGGNCAGAESIAFQYAPPPYKGSLKLEKIGTYLYLSGDFEKAGNNPDCTVHFDSYPLDTLPLLPGEFENLTAQDLNGYCLDIISEFPCETTASFMEVLGAHKMMSVAGEDAYELDVILMGVQQK